jgi:hypothetical protein
MSPPPVAPELSPATMSMATGQLRRPPAAAAASDRYWYTA